MPVAATFRSPGEGKGQRTVFESELRSPNPALEA